LAVRVRRSPANAGRAPSAEKAGEAGKHVPAEPTREALDGPERKAQRKADALEADATRGSGELAMTRAPLTRTLEHALNPQSYIDDVVSHFGINLRGTRAIYDPSLAPGQLGVTRAAEGGRIIRIGTDALVDQATLANTIAHELSHARDFLRGVHKPHGNSSSVGDGTAYGSGNALEWWIRGSR
jgi:hypothetical protein